MNNFDFYNPTHIVFGKDRIKELSSLVPNDSRVLILYGGGSVKRFGTLERVKEALGDRSVFEFSGIEPNPKYETLIKAVDLIKKEKIDFLLAVGGGSVIDGTKFISLACNYDGDLTDVLLREVSGKIKKALPIGVVLTLPATGSEMNSGGVITYDKGKFVIGNPLVFPKFSILEPEITFTLPKTQVANGVVDTFIHVVEQYVTYPVDARFQDRTAEGILKTLIEIGKDTIENPNDYDLRANLVLCATMGLNGLIAMGVPEDWSTHMIGHELTALYGIDHGKTLAIVQPASWSVRKKEKKEKLLQYADRVFNIKDGDEDSRIEMAISKTREFFESLGVKTKLSDYGLDEKNIDEVINSLQKHGLTNLGENGDVTLEVSREILNKAL
ncbi:iron-containing alcohol dehydrogenase [Clostridium sp.]|uniref:iron-containing alcohol dehydrogenase n=1 Tax=Clostridium sp. TaxID=1506 RepID=UPI0026DD7B96|nr:iron-containing alcohol dehydrogenase [Clostridium sp.]MDO5038570.1 iron-containing alcohol dehydrogenase [Clostridium sp.]